MLFEIKNLADTECIYKETTTEMEQYLRVKVPTDDIWNSLGTISEEYISDWTPIYSTELDFYTQIRTNKLKSYLKMYVERKLKVSQRQKAKKSMRNRIASSSF